MRSWLEGDICDQRGNGGIALRKEMTTRDWTSLPTELLLLILGYLQIKDYVLFGSVCISWYHIVAAKHVLPAPHLPWLLIYPIIGPTTRLMFDPFRGKTDFQIQQLRHLTLLGSASGYIIFRNRNTKELLVKNPLTRSCLPLPSVTTLPELREKEISKAAALSSGSTITMVAITYNYGLGYEAVALARPGDDKWAFLGVSRLVTSMIFHKGLLYVLTIDNRTLTWDPRVDLTLLSTLTIYNISIEYRLGYHNFFLVESSAGGDLLQVVVDTKFLGLTPLADPGYTVFKLDSTRTPKWCAVTSLCGDDALLLSPREIVCISTLDFPELQCNCIYSTFPSKGKNMLHVFNVGVGRVVNYVPLPRESEPFPNWFTPSLSA